MTQLFTRGADGDTLACHVAEHKPDDLVGLALVLVLRVRLQRRELARVRAVRLGNGAAYLGGPRAFALARVDGGDELSKDVLALGDLELTRRPRAHRVRVPGDRHTREVARNIRRYRAGERVWLCVRRSASE